MLNGEEKVKEVNNSAHWERIFIQRDYSEGTGVRFQVSPMPAQLQGRVINFYNLKVYLQKIINV